jgi:hypothetical protein
VIVRGLAALVRLMFPAVVAATVKLEMAFALERLIPPEEGTESVVALMAPDWLIAPTAVTVRVPLSVEVPKAMAFVSLIVRLPAFVIATVPKLLEEPLNRVVELCEPIAMVKVPERTIA